MFYGNASPSGVRPLPFQIVPSLYYFEISIFGWMTLNFFRGTLEGEARAEKQDFWVETFQKGPKTASFQKVTSGAENLASK